MPTETRAISAPLPTVTDEIQSRGVQIARRRTNTIGAIGTPTAEPHAIEAERALHPPCAVSTKGKDAMIWRAIEWSVVMSVLCWLFVRMWTDAPPKASRKRTHLASRDVIPDTSSGRFT